MGFRVPRRPVRKETPAEHESRDLEKRQRYSGHRLAYDHRLKSLLETGEIAV